MLSLRATWRRRVRGKDEMVNMDLYITKEDIIRNYKCTITGIRMHYRNGTLPKVLYVKKETGGKLGLYLKKEVHKWALKYKFLPSFDNHLAIQFITRKPMDDSFLTIEQVCFKTQLSESTIKRKIKTGDFVESVSLGRLRRWKNSDVNKWIASQPTGEKRETRGRKRLSSV